MAKREDIEVAIYSDPDFLSLTGVARLVYIWSFTNQRTGMAGIYKVAREQIAMETGFDGKTLEKALTELQEQRFLFYDGRVMFVRTRIKKLRNSGETIAKSIGSDLDSIGNHPFVAFWWEENGHRSWITAHVKRAVTTGDSDGSKWTPSGPQVGSLGYGKGNGSSEVVEEQQRQEEQLPSDFPEEVIPHLDAVFAALSELARRHQAKAVTRYQVALTIKPRSRKPLVKAAHDCAAHWERQGRPLRDVNAAYRNWLDRCDDLGGPEPLGATVHPLPTGSGRFSKYDKAAGL